MTVRTRLVASALVSAALVAVVGSNGALNRRVVEQDLRRVERHFLPLVQALEDVRFAGLRIVSSTSEYVLIRTLHATAFPAHESGGPERRSAAHDRDASERPAGKSEDSGRAEDEARLRQSGVEAYAAAVEALNGLASDQGPERHDFSELQRAGAGLLALSADLLDLADRRVGSDRLLEAKELFERQELRFLAAADRDIQWAADSLNAGSRSVRERVTQDYQLSIAVLLTGSVLALVIGLRTAAVIRRPLQMLARASDDIAAGRYDVALPSSQPDEVGAVARAFGTMVETLGRTTVSKAFVDDIVASIPDGVLVLDAAHRVVQANPALVTLLGASQEEDLVGRDVEGLIPAIRHLDVRGAMMTNVSTASGEVVPVTVTASVLSVSPAGPAGYVCLVQDIRDRLAVERALTEAKEQAEAGARAKSEFLATMSHELRTPLNAIIGYAELLQDGAAGQLAEGDRADLRRIRSAGLLLLDLVKQVLDLAKMEAGKVDLRLGPVAPGPLLNQVAGLVEPMLSPQTALRIDVAPDLPTVTTDGDKLRQVLLNLSSNACKFTKAGEVRLTARPRTSENTPAVEFVVADTGIGMSAEFLPRLFTPFSQAQGSTTGKFGGSGLGMAIAKRLTDALGGTLTVRSTPGEGTVMILLIPTESLSAEEAAA